MTWSWFLRISLYLIIRYLLYDLENIYFLKYILYNYKSEIIEKVCYYIAAISAVGLNRHIFLSFVTVTAKFHYLSLGSYVLFNTLYPLRYFHESNNLVIPNASSFFPQVHPWLSFWILVFNVSNTKIIANE